MSKAHKGKPLSVLHRIAVSDALIANPKVIARAKAQWQNPDFVMKQMRARQIRPNKVELKLKQILGKYFPDEWKYVGDGQVILGGKCPDFINTDGSKQLIELFGVWWHSLFDIAKRTEHFKQYGFSLLVIWDDELDNEEKIITKVKKFMRRKNAHKL